LKQTTVSILHYKGRLTFERIGILLHDLKNRKNYFEIQPVQYKKLLTLMIEVLENVNKYSEYFEDFIQEYPQFLPEFELNLNNDGFILVSRNPVRKEDRKTLAGKIKLINTSKPEELRKIYRETITNGVFTEKGGAGLGFIEMAKIASKDLEFSFHPAAAGYSIYELTIHIKHTEP
jgi:hypothetical protein